MAREVESCKKTEVLIVEACERHSSQKKEEDDKKTRPTPKTKKKKIHPD